MPEKPSIVAIFAIVSAATLQSLPAFGNSEAFVLIATCTEKGATASDGVVVEIYIPDELCCGGYEGLSKGLRPKTRGLYALDLTIAGKGKTLEPVNLGISKDAEGLMVDQYTRSLPVSLVPRVGGTVSFDGRFASEMVCSPLFQNSRLDTDGDGADLSENLDRRVRNCFGLYISCR